MIKQFITSKNQTLKSYALALKKLDSKSIDVLAFRYQSQNYLEYMIAFSTKRLKKLDIRMTVNQTISMQKNLNFTLLTKVEQQTTSEEHRGKLDNILERMVQDNKDEFNTKKKLEMF